VINFTPLLPGSPRAGSGPGRFTPRKDPLYQLNRRLGRIPEPVWTFGGKINLLPLLGFELLTIQPLTQLLYRLPCCGLNKQTNQMEQFHCLLLDVYVSLSMFPRLHAHHQELTTALTAFGFTFGAWR